LLVSKDLVFDLLGAKMREQYRFGRFGTVLRLPSHFKETPPAQSPSPLMIPVLWWPINWMIVPVLFPLVCLMVLGKRLRHLILSGKNKPSWKGKVIYRTPSHQTLRNADRGPRPTPCSPSGASHAKEIIRRF
jgi:hypothetical protein